MAILHEVIPREYRDSISLMQLSASLAKLPGIARAFAVMGTPGNLELLRRSGMEIAGLSLKPDDLLIVVAGEESALRSALQQGRGWLAAAGEQAVHDRAQERAPRSIAGAAARNADANLAIISTPGEYATAEALKALNLGLNVMVFSSNVPLPEEAMLKHRAREKGRIVMGPDCGTAIINGIPLGFANVVRRGAIGVVGASGTGLQEVTVLVDRHGGGISQAIGTGSNDLRAEVGGLSMLAGLQQLADDPGTAVIVLISKPPAPAIAETILGRARECGKPVVAAFLGCDPRTVCGGNIHGARTLEDAASAALACAQGRTPEPAGEAVAIPPGTPRPGAGQRYIRGLFSGGTFALEAVLLLQEAMEVHSNTTAGRSLPLEDGCCSRGHTILDLGAEMLTRGRPHPMIDYRLRADRIVAEAGDLGTAVLLLDVVLGFGSHANPAAELAPALRRARGIAEKAGRAFICVGHVCGTDRDPQGLAAQERALRQAGMILTGSNAQAARLARRIVTIEDPTRSSPSSCPRLSRASTSSRIGQGVDGRDKPGHDD
jgi:succinyl-CoA synthetase alpha subunit